MSSLARARDAAVEAVLAGAAAAVIEGFGVGGRIPIVAGTAAFATIVVALVGRTLLTAAVRLEPLRSWSRALAAPGASRVVAAWRLLLALVAVSSFTVVTFRVFVWAHAAFRFKESDAIGALVVTGELVLVLVLLAGSIGLDRIVRDRLPPLALEGRAGVLAAGAALALLAVVPPLAVARAVPSVSVLPVVVASSLLAALVLARGLSIGSHRGAWVGTGLCVAGAVTAMFALPRSPAARLAIVERGAASSMVAHLMWSLSDGDHDGFVFADCRPDDRSVHPGATDVPDNGIDENCSAGDANAASYGVRATSRPATAKAAKPNVVVISVDALRADRLGAYGYSRPTSPALDTLAASGVRFAQAYTACPSTRCAIPALHTGRFVSTLPPVAARAIVPSLASTFAAAGYSTAAITCCERFASARAELTGFVHVDATADGERMARAGQSNADAVVDRALAWLQARPPSVPYLLWVHLYEPHFPYEAPGGPSFGDSASDRYDREVAFADAQIARLLATVDASTIVVVTSDHGEELGEHGIRFHARSLYNQVVRVPLIVRAPGATPRVVDTPVSLVDVMPTLLELAGVPGPAGMNGVSLTPALEGKALAPRAVLVELPHDHQITRDMAAAIQPPWKVIWDREVDAWTLYRIDDTADTHAVDDATALSTMRQVLMDLLDRETGALPN